MISLRPHSQVRVEVGQPTHLGDQVRWPTGCEVEITLDSEGELKAWLDDASPTAFYVATGQEAGTLRATVRVFNKEGFDLTQVTDFEVSVKANPPDAFDLVVTDA